MQNQKIATAPTTKESALHGDEKSPSLEDYEVLASEKTQRRCPYCHGILGSIEHYDHPAGWPVQSFEKLQWLYKTCTKCGYQWSLQNLGISR